MKQSSASSTRGRKKATGSKQTSSRGAAATQQNRNRSGSGSNSASRSSSNSSTNRNSSANRSNSNTSSNNSDIRSTNSRGKNSDSRKNDNRGASSTNTTMRGNSSGSAVSRQRMTSRSGHKEFTGETHLEKFFLDQLQDIYYAENKIVRSLPKMADAATTPELRDAFEDHLHQTQRHIKRLEKAFETIGKKAEGKKCEAIEGIAREVEQIIDETEDGTLTRDAALIIAAQKVEHYEIATYGGLVQLAITMELHDAADLLDKTLVEEEDTDARLTEIAENEINLRAEHEDDQNSWQNENSDNGQEEEENGTQENEDASIQ